LVKAKPIIKEKLIMAAARSCGSPTISFGLLSIPTKLYLAAASESFSFNMITPDGNRVKQKLVDAVTDEEVQRGDCDRGFEYTKDQFVIFTDDELDSLAGEKANSIELAEFASDTVFDPLQVEKAYYLAPDKGAEKAYRLLVRTLEKTGKVAVGKWYARGKDHLVILIPTGKDSATRHLTMFQMYYANEVRGFEYQFSDKSEPTEAEVEMAKMLISKLSTKNFDVKKYNDEFAERIRTAIDAKIADPEQEVKAGGKTNVPTMDLLAMLKASLEQTKPSEPAVVVMEKPAVPKKKRGKKAEVTVGRLVNGKVDSPTGDDLGGPPPSKGPGLKKTTGKK
jgi:DNA end-binding protein Ku